MSPTAHLPRTTWLPPLAVTALVWSLLPGVLPLFQLQAETWNWALASPGLPHGVEELSVAALIGAFCAGFFCQAGLGAFRAGMRLIFGFCLYVALVLVYLALASFQNSGVLYWGSGDALPSSLIGLTLGCVVGAIVARQFEVLLPRERFAKQVWPWLAAMPFVLAVLPIAGDASVVHLNFSAFMELPQRFYQLLKGLILWLPVGLVFALAGQGRALRVWGVAAVVTLPLVLNASLLELPWRDLMSLLAALPGLAGGIWMAERGGFVLQASTGAVAEGHARTGSRRGIRRH